MPALRQRSTRAHEPWIRPRRGRTDTHVGRLPWALDRTEVEWRPELPEWQKQALCRQVDPSLFFSNRGEPSTDREAKRVCHRCDVRASCLEWALGFDSEEDEYGVLGGVGPVIRDRMRRDRIEVAA